MFDQLRFNLAQIRNKSSSIVIRRRTRHRQQFWSPEGSQSWPWQSLAKTNASSVFPLTERINWTHSVSLFFHRFPMASNGNYTAHWVSMSFSVFWRVDFRNLQLHSGAEWEDRGSGCTQSLRFGASRSAATQVCCWCWGRRTCRCCCDIHLSRVTWFELPFASIAMPWLACRSFGALDSSLRSLSKHWHKAVKN